MSVGTRPAFLYPCSRQFPFDEVSERIVRALEARNWNVPGIRVTFRTAGDGVSQMVDSIAGDGFRLWFCRVQRSMGHWNDTAAVTELAIPGRELHVHDNEDGPTYYVYVGGNWSADKERFISYGKVNSKLNREPRMYLRYKGQCGCGGARGMAHTHRGRRSSLLVHDNDLGREYDPEGDEPRSYRTDQVFAAFTRWLKSDLLARIEAVPAVR